MLRIEVPPIESRAHIVTFDVSVSADSGAAKKRGDGGRSSVFGAGPQYQHPSHVTSQEAFRILESHPFSARAQTHPSRSAISRSCSCSCRALDKRTPARR